MILKIGQEKARLSEIGIIGTEESIAVQDVIDLFKKKAEQYFTVSFQGREDPKLTDEERKIFNTAIEKLSEHNNLGEFVKLLWKTFAHIITLKFISPNRSENNQQQGNNTGKQGKRQATRQQEYMVFIDFFD